MRATGEDADSMTSVSLLGVRVDGATVAELHHVIDEIIAANGRENILYANVHGLNLAYEQTWLRELYNRSKFVICDGAGVLLAARWFGVEIPERITYADWTWDLAAHAELKGYSMFLLGGRPGVAALAANRLLQRHPNLRMVGTHHGFFDKRPHASENLRIIDMVNSAEPNLLLVGFGMPVQERWLMENQHRLTANVMLAAGAALDYVSGMLRRAPYALRACHAEWLGRLFIEPRRLWRRYLLGNPKFGWRLIRHRAIGLRRSRVQRGVQNEPS